MALVDPAEDAMLHLPDATELTGRVAVAYGQDRNGPLMDAVEEHAGGLPENSIRVAVPQVGAIGAAFLLAALARGARGVIVVLSRAERGRLVGLEAAMALAEAASDGLEFGAGRFFVVEEDDPWVLADRLRAVPVAAALEGVDGTTGEEGGEASLRRILGRLDRRRDDAPVALPPGSPAGRLLVDAALCTLCQGCARACPGGALVVSTDQAMLGFIEDACVQCGVCKQVCPEKAITLEPRWAGRGALEPQVLMQDEILHCRDCGAVVGPKSSVDRMVAVLSGHQMFQDKEALERLKLCERCR